jgi:hypothetical protein
MLMKVSYGLYMLAVGVYALSFFLPTSDSDLALTAAENRLVPGYEAFGWGLSGPFADEGVVFFLTWLANPCFWVGAALWLRKRKHGAAFAATGAFLLAGWPLLLFGSLHAGYFLWISSFALLAAAGLSDHRAG